MPVKVDFNGKTVWYKLSDFGNGDKLSLESDAGDKIGIEIPLKLDPLFKDKEFDIYFLAKKKHQRKRHISSI